MSSSLAVGGFEPALSVLDSAFFFRHAPRGIGSRLIAITVLHVYIILASLLLLGLTQLDDHRKEKKNTLWAWRLIRRPSGLYFAVNQIFIIPTLAILGSIIQIINTIYTFQAVLHNGPLREWMLWRTLPALALFVTGWQMSWASFQASALVFESSGKTGELWWWSPKAAMGMFLGLGTAGTLATLTLILLGTFHWHTVCDIAVAIRSLAGTGDASDLSTQLAMRKLLEGFREANLVHQADLSALFIVVCVGQSITTLFMLSSIFLARHLRRQVLLSITSFKKESVSAQAHVSSDSSATFSITSLPSVPITDASALSDSPLLSPSATSFKIPAAVSPPPSPSSLALFPHLGALREVAKSVAVDDAWRKQTATRILALEKAGQDLLIVGVYITGLSTAFVGASLWLLLDDLPTNPVNWVWMEVSITIHSWLYGGTFSVLLSSLCVNAYCHLAPRTKGRGEKETKEGVALVEV